VRRAVAFAFAFVSAVRCGELAQPVEGELGIKYKVYTIKYKVYTIK